MGAASWYPGRPGEPGTMITNRVDDLLRVSPAFLFVRGSELAQWRYIGEFEFKQSDRPLTAAEFRRLPEKTRQKWATSILRRRDSVASTMKAESKVLGLETADILDAFDAGQEELTSSSTHRDRNCENSSLPQQCPLRLLWK
ncbi:hypothetical protein FA95DRAFT_1022470 [Auriscalpium vulgare]|uniref:Uncharacterized protein n=1 Tax=Auriscalpium vulgare TaxID=40419 RepID=A0ACB8RXD6_9AGAM|nr:hypothetical protein FA95DRAFT_1022470 [Auriscalpium vulgare]